MCFFTVFYKNIFLYSPDFPRLQAFFCGFYVNYRMNSGADGKTNGENVCENKAIVL